MKPPIAHRLVGLCVFSTLTIAAFSLKTVWWALNSPAGPRPPGLPMTSGIAVLAAVAGVACWRERPWGYLLAILLCVRENVLAVHSFYSQPVAFRSGGLFDVALAGVPIHVGAIAAIALLINHYTRKQDLNPASAP